MKFEPTLFEHNLWANQQIVEMCLNLSREQLEAQIEGTSGTLHQILIHLLASETYYIQCLTGRTALTDEELSSKSLLEIAALLGETGQSLLEAARKTQPHHSVVLKFSEEPKEISHAIILTQAIVHAGEHREQAKTILTQLGMKPIDLSAWAYHFHLIKQNN